NALPSAAALIKEGKLRALAVTSAERAPEFPDVPTLAEAGAPGQVSLFFQGIVAPAGTPKEIVHQLYREIAKILARPEPKERLAAIGFAVTVSSPEEFQAQIKSETARWAKVIREADIKKIE
ncbi:MAG: Bug family tripartite tricarboxylate transporter substrate binding protein, partial [Xanthobacteraceae bacterium]